MFTTICLSISSAIVGMFADCVVGDEIRLFPGKAEECFGVPGILSPVS